ncbi:MAG: hypothetical protein AB1650_09070 [Candidatus Omnitrophota bacterium]
MKNKLLKLLLVLALIGSSGLIGCETNTGEGLEDTGEELEQGTEEMQQEMDQEM